MKTKFKKLICFFATSLMLSLPAISQQDACFFIGQSAVPATRTVGLGVCATSGIPAACKIGMAALSCEENPACVGMIEKLVTDGCEIVVEKSGSMYKITAKWFNGKYEDAKKSAKELYNVLKKEAKVKFSKDFSQ